MNKFKQNIISNEDCDIQFQKVETGNGFQNNLIATSNNRIELAIIEICRLKKTIISLDSKNEKLQKWMFVITIIGVIFTMAQIVQVVDIFERWLK